jgi:hypothetical protein
MTTSRRHRRATHSPGWSTGPSLCPPPSDHKPCMHGIAPDRPVVPAWAGGLTLLAYPLMALMEAGATVASWPAIPASRSWPPQAAASCLRRWSAGAVAGAVHRGLVGPQPRDGAARGNYAAHRGVARGSDRGAACAGGVSGGGRWGELRGCAVPAADRTTTADTRVSGGPASLKAHRLARVGRSRQR